MKIGVARERAPHEHRVALIPESLAKLRDAVVEVLVENGAGDGASFPDQAYADAGARIVTGSDLFGQSDAIVRVQKPDDEEARLFRRGQVVVGLLQPLIGPRLMQQLAD